MKANNSVNKLRGVSYYHYFIFLCTKCYHIRLDWGCSTNKISQGDFLSYYNFKIIAFMLLFVSTINSLRVITEIIDSLMQHKISK